MAGLIPKLLTLANIFCSVILVQSFLHGDHFDGALGHGLVYEEHGPHQQKTIIANNLPVNAHPLPPQHPLPLAEPPGHPHHHILLNEHHSVKQHHLLPLPPAPQHHQLHHPIPEPESHLQQTTIIHHPSEHHPIPEPEIPHHGAILKTHHLGPIPQPEHHGDLYLGDHGPHPEPYPGHNLQPRFDPSHLAVHGYENFHQTIIPAPAHYQPHPHHMEQHLIHGPPPPPPPAHYLPQHHPEGGYHGFYHNRKPGDGFGPGGHFDLMPHQEIKYVPVPEPVPVYKPIPVDKPYPVPVEKPYPVPVERPIPEPYISKVIQPVIHKQAIIKSHVTHLTHEYPHPSHAHHSPGYHKSKK